MYKKIIMSVKKSKIKNINSGKKLQIYQLYMRERERERARRRTQIIERFINIKIAISTFMSECMLVILAAHI